MSDSTLDEMLVDIGYRWKSKDDLIKEVKSLKTELELEKSVVDKIANSGEQKLNKCEEWVYTDNTNLARQRQKERANV